MRRRTILVILGGVILLELALLAPSLDTLQFLQSASPPPALHSNLPEDRDGFRAYWAGRIDEAGAEYAYGEFRSRYYNTGNQSEHTLAHWFGELLYERKGLAGASACDDAFAFGCFHSFLGTAIHDHGIEVAAELDKICVKRLGTSALGCQHGIGHGIAAAIGYEFPHLLKSLDVCDGLPVNDPIGGCIGGVFMEYNLRTMLDREGTTRAFDPENPHAPCNDLSAPRRVACYHWQPQWWLAVLPGELSAKVAMIASLCGERKVPMEYEQCFIGLGDFLGQQLGWNAEKVRNYCVDLPDPRSELPCRIGAASAFFAEPQRRAFAKTLCDGLTSKHEQTCLAFMATDTEAPRDHLLTE